MFVEKLYPGKQQRNHHHCAILALGNQWILIQRASIVGRVSISQVIMKIVFCCHRWISTISHRSSKSFQFWIHPLLYVCKFSKIYGRCPHIDMISSVSFNIYKYGLAVANWFIFYPVGRADKVRTICLFCEYQFNGNMQSFYEIMQVMHTCVYWGCYLGHGLTLIPTWINCHMHTKVWDKITYPFTNFNNWNIYHVSLRFCRVSYDKYSDHQVWF